MVKPNDLETRIFREVLASLIGSKMSSRELKCLSDLLQSNRQFTYDLSRSVFDLSKNVERQTPLFGAEVEAAARSDEGLASLAYNVVQRRRLAKRDLLALIKGLSPKLAETVSGDMSAREILEVFFSVAGTSQMRALLRELGMNVEEDPYLGGIARRVR